ncbi:serine/threonine-protein kinase ZRK3 [Citrus sinensis]|uniref:Serine/threonine-protein kinase ZRK3 n=1 Tax=Citrus sinensis TaxID=2711 RepID=A0ACB8KLF0_CITSI|nr:serine/threonine-protein kinase ZRK3 [Citrus sinensis]
MELANAVAYPHAGFARPIIFMSATPWRIFFDEQNVAKLFDFSLFVSIPEGETHVDFQIAGTKGYIAPKVLLEAKCNEKYDVHSFGMLLLDLLTGQKITSFCRDKRLGVENYLWDLLKKYVEENGLNEMVDPMIIEEGLCPRKEQLLQDYLDFAFKCVSESPEERPTMIDMAKQLRQMYLSWIKRRAPLFSLSSILIDHPQIMYSCLGAIKNSGKEDKEKCIMRNGKNLLENLISSFNGKRKPILSFSAEELKIATNNYDLQRVKTQGFVYQLYNAFLHGRPMSVMKFQNNDKYDAYEWCLKNIVFASQMSHSNILMLIGCCLETQIPVLVFESVSSGILANYIHGPRPSHFEPFLLTHRLKIAMEIANALAYLHVGFPRPIVFKNIKLSSILFDEDHVAKLFDFSLAESIPDGETHIKDAIPIGIMGFVATEYVTTGDYNEKCDVFSFGVLLLVLLTGQKLYSIDEAGDRHWLLNRVKKHIECNTFDEIVDPVIREELCIQSSEKDKQVQAFVELAVKCVSESAEDRPTMIDVAKQLRQAYRFGW